MAEKRRIEFNKTLVVCTTRLSPIQNKKGVTRLDPRRPGGEAGLYVWLWRSSPDSLRLRTMERVQNAARPLAQERVRSGAARRVGEVSDARD